MLVPDSCRMLYSVPAGSLPQSCETTYCTAGSEARKGVLLAAEAKQPIVEITLHC